MIGINIRAGAAVSILAYIAIAAPANAAQAPIRDWLDKRRADRQHVGSESVEGIAGGGDYTFEFAHDRVSRKYRVHVPPQYQQSQAMPLMIALHGGGGNMDYQADDARYGLISKADAAGFIVVFPNGYSRRKNGKLATWNAGECCGAARDGDADDVGFIRRVLEQVRRRFSVDADRIFATGMSNGGMMAYRLACEMPETIRAIAAVAGTDNTTQCSPSKPISVLHIHARDDSHVLFEGGAGPDAIKAAVTEFASVPGTISKWTRLNGCSVAARRVLERPGAYCERYSPCDNRAAVQLCVMESGGHSWPGGNKRRGEPASQAISANDVMWDFFENVASSR